MRQTENQGLEGGQRIAPAVGFIRIKRRAAEFKDLVAFDKTEEGAGLELKATECPHKCPDQCLQQCDNILLFLLLYLTSHYSPKR